MSELSVFQVPELVTAIGEYLDQRSLARCMAINRMCHEQLEPLLWRTFSMEQGLDELILQQNWDHLWGLEGKLRRRKRRFVRVLDISCFAEPCLGLYVPAVRSTRTKEMEVEEEEEEVKGDVKEKEEEEEGDEERKEEEFRDASPSSSPTITLVTGGAATGSTNPKEDDDDSFEVTQLRYLKVQVGLLDMMEDSWAEADALCPSEAILRLLVNNSLLTTVHLPANLLELEGVNDLLANILMHSLPNLQHLTLSTSSSLQVPFENALVFLMAVCQRDLPLRILECFFTMEYDSTWDQEMATKRLPQMFAPPFQTLERVRFPDMVPGPLVVHFLRYCMPELVQLEIPWMAEARAQEMAVAVTEGCWKLKGLSVELMGYDQVGDSWYKVPVAVVNSCRELTSFQGTFFRDGQGHGQELFEALLRHAATLEELVWEEPQLLESLHLQEMLVQGRNLQRFEIRDPWEDQVALQFKDGIQAPWACGRTLKSLRIVLGRELKNFLDYLHHPLEEGPSRDFETEHQKDPAHASIDPEVAAKALEALQGYFGTDSNQEGFDPLSRRAQDAASARKLYQQIGSLTELEELGIMNQEDDRYLDGEKVFLWDLTMRVGLPYLNGLTNLKRLHLLSSQWLTMGRAEIEFMAANWPKLEEILFDRDPLFIQDDGWLDLSEDSPWTWLRKQLPRLRYL